ncbi:MAG: heavy metal-responsive transcriptional regulator [Actinobacteria bacterium]|jgi:DNA-binding transcriptional MerR regulator|nr:heavy metal-responsive transcriptional regulator [Actinomycetota bacterium]
MKIGELADESGYATRTIRFYERIGLLPPPEREPNGYRSYNSDALRRLRFIRQAQAAGLTLREIGEVLAIRSQGRAPCVHVRDLIQHHLAQVDARLAELRTTKRELEDLAEYAQSVDPADCPRDAICAILVRER